MEPPKRRVLEPSGIPRPSKLPVPRGAVSSIPQNTFSGSLSRRPAISAAIQQRSQPNHGSIQSREALQGQEKAENSNERSEETCEQSGSPLKPQSTRRRTRPSLSDRTMETLAQIPPSPSPRRRRSSFFQMDSPIASPLRPGSSLARARPSTSMGVRPSTRMDDRPPLPDHFSNLRPASPEKRRLASTTGNQTPQRMPKKSDVGSYVPRSLPHPRPSLGSAVEFTPSKSKPSVTTFRSDNNRPALGAAGQMATPKLTARGKTLGVRPPKTRSYDHPAVGEPSGIASMEEKEANSLRPRQMSAKTSSVPPISSSKVTSPLKKLSQAHSAVATSSSPKTTPQKSSASLRETIAKAKAARQKALKTQGKEPSENQQENDGFVIDLGGSNKGLLKKRIAMARTDGRLNIAAMKLSEIPPEVLNMYDPDADASASGGAWYENVDLVKLIAADNDIEELGDPVFPDEEVNGQNYPDEDYKGNMFGGLETLDLHGNRLQSLPLGVRRLERLTVLNLSKNRLSNEAFGVIGQIQSLRDLHMTDNALEGTLDSRVLKLSRLEVLDLNNNKLSTLPEGIGNLTALHTLSLAGNRIASIPLDSLASTVLAVLDVSLNKLQGPLLSAQATEMPFLKSLDVSNNALTSITDGLLAMPSLQNLNVEANRLQTLPNLARCADLITINASENRINAIPEGLESSTTLKNVDFSQNDIKRIDERFGLLETLAVFRIANNPLRERRLLTLNTEDLKRDLRAKLAPAEDEGVDSVDVSTFDGASQAKPFISDGSWPVKSGGILDRSSTNTNAIDVSDLETLVKSNDVKTFILRQNSLTQLPRSLELLASTLTTLDISHNRLSGNAYLASELSLPNLKVLDISHNTITSLTPLFEFLPSPKLSELNLSRNRLRSLPPLRIAFPSLKSVLAADNGITELKVNSVQGLEALDVSGNEIEQLEPKLGLLGGEGLRTLLVGANRFRVPRREVVEKGTGAILAWLKGRIPEGEI